MRNASPGMWRCRFRQACARLGLAVLGVTIVLLLLEVGLRIVDPKIPTSTVMSVFFEYDSTLGWRGKSEARGAFVTSNFATQVSHDRQGWRQTDLSSAGEQAAGANTHVVWCVGDSMIWGWGVSDGQTVVDHLNRAAAPGTIYCNRGIPGYSAVQEYLLLKQLFELGSLPHEVVVFFVPNDWSGNLADPPPVSPQPRAELRDGQWAIAGTPVPHTLGWPVRTGLSQHSRAFAFLNYHYQRARQWKRKHGAGRFEPATHEPTETEVAAMRFVYGQMRTLCREYNVRLSVASGFWSEPQLARLCDELEIPFISAEAQRPSDYDPATIEPEQALTFATDPHWSPRGHALIARAVHDGLDRAATTAWGLRPSNTRTK